VYDPSGIRFALAVPPGFTAPSGPGWKLIGTPASPKGYRYKDSTASSQGVKDVKLLASSLNRASIKLVAKGLEMPDYPPPPYAPSVRAQLYSSDGTCWDATFDASTLKKNADGQFKAKVTVPQP
jgi:hypothetical protein